MESGTLQVTTVQIYSIIALLGSIIALFWGIIYGIFKDTKEKVKVQEEQQKQHVKTIQDLSKDIIKVQAESRGYYSGAESVARQVNRTVENAIKKD